MAEVGKNPGCAEGRERRHLNDFPGRRMGFALLKACLLYTSLKTGRHKIPSD